VTEVAFFIATTDRHGNLSRRTAEKAFNWRCCQLYAVIAADDSIAGGVNMATLTVRKLDDDLVRRLRIQAAEHGRSAEAEHRAILQAALTERAQASPRQQAAERLAEFRQRTAGAGSASVADLLEQSRAGRMATLTRTSEGA
jgi:plasmid stability protein